MKYQILQGDNRETLKTIADNSIDAIITDPPYGIDFLGKSWDANTGALETYQECLRVLKPGGHILAFSAARTYHHLAVTLEQAGFEIRDQIMWIYSSGFPKSQDVGRQLHKKEHGKPDKQRFDPAIMIRVSGDQYRHPDTGKIYRALPDINGDRLAVSHEGNAYGVVYEQVIEVDSVWSGWGSALKPAHEPIALARKPMRGSIKDNCLTWGVGAINIDATRVPWGEDDDPEAYIEWMKKYPSSTGNKSTFNNILSESQGKERVADCLSEVNPDRERLIEGRMSGRFPSNVLGEIAEPYQKYFYCPKVSRKERHIGFDFDKMPTIGNNNGNPMGQLAGDKNSALKTVEKSTSDVGNNHPTVKPIELMKYLIRLITPEGGVVLDPFSGSGSTGCAAVELGYEYIGCELDPAYVEIAKKRIEAWYALTHPLQATGLFE